MSLAIQKFQEGGSPETRLFKRGNDYVDADRFIRDAENGIDAFISGLGLKEKERIAVRKAYLDIINKINDDPASFEGRLGGGFSNTANITNAPEGLDAYGIAATHLGTILRASQAYRKPKEKTSSKNKYTRDGAMITSELLKALIGSNPDSFRMLDNDSYDEESGYMSAANRYAHLINGLKTRRLEILDSKEYDSPEDRNHAEGRFNDFLAVLENDNPNDDWFALEQFGFTNPGAYFSTGREISATPKTKEELDAAEKEKRIRYFEDWMNTNHPLYTGTLANPITIGTDVGIADSNQLQELRRRLGTLSLNDTRDWIRTYIADPSYNFLSDPTFINLYGGLSKSGTFTNSLLNRYVLDLAIINGLAKQIAGTNAYYLPGTLKTYDNGSSTVYVYNSQNGIIQLVDTLDVADYQKLYELEYEESNPDYSAYEGSYKFKDRYAHRYGNGGVLKGLSGLDIGNIISVNGNPMLSWMDNLFDKTRLNNQAYESWILAQYGSDPKTGQAWLSSLKLPGWTPELSRALRKPSIGGLNLPEPSIDQAYRLLRNYINSGNIVKDVQSAYLNWRTANPEGSYEDFIQLYNSKVDNVRNLGQTRFNKGVNATGFLPLYDDYNWLYGSNVTSDYNFKNGIVGALGDLNDLNGTSMDLRNALYFLNDEDSVNKRSGSFDDNLGGPQFWVNNEGKLEIRKPLGSDENPIESPEFEVVALKKDLTQLDETGKNGAGIDTGDIPNPSNTPSYGGDLTRYLALGAARLADVLNTNKNIEKVVDRNLLARRHNPYWTWAPEIDKYNFMNYKNNLGTQVVDRMAKSGKTSNITDHNMSLLDAYRMKNNISTLGYLESDETRKQSRLDALKHVWANTERGTTVANLNRDFNVDYFWKKGLLQASRLLKDQQARSAYMGELQGLAYDDYTYNKGLNRYFAEQDLVNERNYYDKLGALADATTASNTAVDSELREILKLLQSYQMAGKDPTLEDWYPEVATRLLELQLRSLNSLLMSLGKRKGWFTKDFYPATKPLTTWTYSGYYAKNGGPLHKLIKKQK